MLKIINFIKSIFERKDEISYPDDFAEITFSEVALERGIEDDQNKIITRHFFDRFGMRTEKKYRYSRERVNALREIHRIPIYDRTQENQTFPLFFHSNPSEASFKTES